MSSSKAAMVRRTTNRPRRGGMPEQPPAVRVEEFVAQNRRFRWREGAGMAVVRAGSVLTEGSRRGSLAALFTRTVVPQLERRGARGVVFAAAAPAGVTAADVRWVAWRAPEEPQPVWGLYVAARTLGSSPATPANDSFVLVAWGDGPVLAWADEREAARAALRAALHAPPPWLVRGMRSGDTSFPVRIEKLSGRDAQLDAADTNTAPAPCVALTPAVAAARQHEASSAPATAQRAPGGVSAPPVPVITDPRRAVLDVLQSWKRTHVVEADRAATEAEEAGDAGAELHSAEGDEPEPR